MSTATQEAPPKMLGAITQEEASKLFQESSNKVNVDTPPAEPVKDPNTQDPQEKKPENKKAETKTAEKETKEAVAEKTAEVEKPKKLRERIKGKFFEETPKEETKKEEVSISDIQKELAEAKKELSDPELKILKSLRLKGKKVLEEVRRIANIDADKMSDQEIVRHDIIKSGITDPDKIQEEMDIFFNEGSERVRKKEIDSLRAGIRKEAESAETELFNVITAPDVERAEAERIENEKIQRDAEQFQNTVTSMIGQEVYGLKVTKDMANILTKTIEQNELIPKKDDGSIDTKGLSEMLFLYKFKDLILDEIEKTAYANGVHKIADEVEATPASSAINSRPPEIQTKIQKGSEQEAKQISESLKPFNPYQ